MITRRILLIGFALSMLTRALPSSAQGKTTLPRVGFFYLGSPQSALDTGRYAAFIQGMKELGYQEGKQFVLVARFGDGDYKRYPSIAAELAAAKPDVIVSTATATHEALKKVTAVIPVVVTTSFDPVREGYADSLARPGRNFTGVAALLTDIFPKHIQLLKVALPRLARVAVLWNPGNAAHPHLLDNIDAVARGNSIRVTRVGASTPQEIEAGFATMVRERVEALIVLGDALFVQRLRQLGEQAVERRLVSVYSTREFAEFGGFMTYGPSFRENYRRVATYVDKILRGAKPGDLPFEQPTKFELVINMKTARALGVTIPPELLLRADEVIE
jgi:ABC-type uncharacterized transport system substrate-binding protein